MSLLLVAPNRDMSKWKNAIHKIDSDIDVEIWPNVSDKQRVHFAVCWNHPDHVLDQYPNLKAVSSLGAGADHLLNDESLAEEIAICRVISPSLVQQMKEYVLGAVISIQRNFIHYAQLKEEGLWKPLEHKTANEISVGVMGLGELGKPVASQLSKVGFDVAGWSRTPKSIKGVSSYCGEKEWNDFLESSEILICLLPLTNQTKGILNLDTFKKMKRPGWIINVARGEHLVDEDLIYALDSGILGGAWLDVFSDEPLSDRHAFWNRNNIMITPHVASVTQPEEAAEQIINNYKRALSGMELEYKVERERGY